MSIASSIARTRSRKRPSKKRPRSKRACARRSRPRVSFSRPSTASAPDSGLLIQDERARVRAAFFADAERCFGVRLFAAVFAWRESARGEAAARPSCFRALLVARERFAEGFACEAPLAES